MDHEPDELPFLARPSASMDASRAAELERIKAMTMVERMELALELGRLCASVELPKAPR